MRTITSVSCNHKINEMTTKEVAQKLVSHYNAGELDQITELYDENVVSIEKDGSGDHGHIQGLEARKQKTEQWQNMMETHNATASEPLVSENQFAVRFEFDCTQRDTGERMQVDEIGIYHVRDGKIVREQFWYGE